MPLPTLRRPGAVAVSPLLVAFFLAAAGTSRAQVLLYGKDCGRIGSPPKIAFGAVRASDPLPVTVTMSRTGQAVALLVGLSDTRWGPYSLPLDLRFQGWDGCFLNAAPQLHIAPRTLFGHIATWRLDLSPFARTGVRFYAQAAAFDTSGMAGISKGARVTLSGHGGAIWTLATIPDTQYYAQHTSYFRHFTGVTKWLRANAKDLAFVSHVGDIVQSGGVSASQWTRALLAMNELEDAVPYYAVIGNHDYDKVNDKSRATKYRQHFGPQRYAKRSWFRGADKTGLNAFQVFTAGGVQRLHLGIEWQPSDKAIGWAQSVLAAHADLPAILTVHEYLGPGQPARRRDQAGATPDGSGRNTGEDIYRKLVVPFPQVFLVLCGHIIGAGQLTSTTALGETVHQLLSNYQGDPEGGNGFFRRMRMDPARKTIQVSTQSETWGSRSRGPNRAKLREDNFTLSFDFRAHEQRLRRRVLRFRHGQDLGQGLYSGALDTLVGSGRAGRWRSDRSYGAEPLVWCDADGDREQGLLRFDGLIGTGPGRVPPRARIQSAVLTLTTEGGGADSAHGGRLYRLTRSWSESSTWDALGAGIQIGSETHPTHDADSAGAVAKKGTRSFDVTRSVQAWADGTPNHGWAVFGNGTDAWGFRSSEWHGGVERPLLTVILR